jgi:hypothetical protein
MLLSWISLPRVLLILSLLTSGCGFEPVYSKRTTGKSSTALSQVKVMPVPGRLGQLFVAALEDKLNPNASNATIRYELKPNISVQMVPISIAADGTASRFRVLYQTNYTIYDREVGKQIHTDRIQRSGSYEVLIEADYSTYVAEQDALSRGIDELSQDYLLRVAAFLKGYEAKQARGI